MNLPLRAFLLAIAMSCASACDSGSPASGRDGSVADLPFERPVCSGAADVRLALTMESSGQSATFGDSVLDENGGYFALIEGTCKAFAQNGYAEPVVSITLTAEEAEALAEAISVDEWSEYNPSTCYPVSDLSDTTLTADSTQVVIGGCAPENPDRRPWEAFMAFGEEIEALYARGTAISGTPVRYSLVRAGVWESPAPGEFEGAPDWPLGDATAVVSPTPEGTVTRHTASGADAETLRALRSRWMQGEFGSPRYPGTDNIPVYNADGSELFLYMRDVVPDHEDGKGQWTFLQPGS